MTATNEASVKGKKEVITPLHYHFATIGEVTSASTVVLQSAENTDFKKYLPPSNNLNISFSCFGFRIIGNFQAFEK